MDGSPAAFLGRSGPHPIASYDTRPIERVGDIHRGSHDQLVGELRAIGYIE